jgi:hypothetical protein
MEGVGLAVIGDLPALGEARPDLGAVGIGMQQPGKHDALDDDVGTIDGLDRIEGQHLRAVTQVQDLLALGIGAERSRGPGDDTGGGQGGSLQKRAAVHCRLPVPLSVCHVQFTGIVRRSGPGAPDTSAQAFSPTRFDTWICGLRCRHWYSCSSTAARRSRRSSRAKPAMN